ncbi:MAG: M56 family metallopeptidase [Pirellulales bacterium]
MNASPVASIVESLGWTLVHFVWQGALVAALLFATLRLVQRASPNLCYALGCAALGLMMAAAVVTFAWQMSVAQFERTVKATVALAGAGNSPPEATARDAQRVSAAAEPRPEARSGVPVADTMAGWGSREYVSVARLTSWAGASRPWLPKIVGLWAVCVGVLCLRLVRDWNAIRRIRACGGEIEESYWIERLAHLRQVLGISYPVRLLSSTRATVPFVVGWLKPVVLLPAGILTGLSPVELEAILAHELAHVRRHDFLVNLLQTMVETLFFYHPAVWWVSGQVRQEREHCCDTIAAAYTGDRLVYARALVALEERRRAPVALGVAASGGSLVTRIRRLVGESPQRPGRSGWPIAALSLISGVLIALAAAGGLNGQEQPPASAPGAQRQEPETDPKPNQDGITIRVLDAKDKKPIPWFRVLAGVPGGRATSRAFRERTGLEGTNWQPHTVRVGKGEFVWPLDRRYREMTLRVEAGGYQPQMSRWINESERLGQLEFLLVADPGRSGRVLKPDGTPAAGATVALALAQKDAVIENGLLRGELDPLPEKESDRWRRPTLVKTDAVGRFRLHTETDPGSAALVMHESGIRVMPATELQEHSEITLQAWGRIEGQVLWKDKPGAGELVTLHIDHDEYGYPGIIRQQAEATSDAQGRFVFEKVLPGRVQLSRFIKLPQKGKSGATSALCEGMYSQVSIRPGQPTPVVIGGQGRKVTGRLTGRDSWDGVTLRIHPDAPHFGSPGDDEQWHAFGIFRASAIGPLFFRDKLQPNADGTFAIPHMLPGRYQMFVSAPGVENFAAHSKIQVDSEVPGEIPPPVDIGEIQVKPPEK